MTETSSPFMTTYRGYLSNILKWEELETLWQTVRGSDSNWFVYAVGETLPQTPSSREELSTFIDEIDKLLRQEHQESYCGIVYVDDRDSPSLIKIYDPNHLGSSCGPGWGEVLPGWVLSTMPPQELEVTSPIANNRRRWWRKLLGQ
ncbi:MAG: hypothetical protein OEZ16_13150 [Chromatiales bacterium]|nr:hypothetical protein [Chromatiales bacterium]